MPTSKRGTSNFLGYPIANWKNPEEYPNPKKDNNIFWGWEFLRRNRDYQNDYKVFRKTKSFTNKQRLRKRWGFKEYLIDPKISKPKSLKFEFPEFPKPIHFNEEDLRKTTIKNPFRSPADFGYIFNINLPIKEQINRVEKELKTYQSLIFKSKIELGKKYKIEYKVISKKSFPKKHQENMVVYLRLLDAKASKIKNADILKVIYPGSKHPEAEPIDNLKKNLSKAKSYCNNYHTLFFI